MDKQPPFCFVVSVGSLKRTTNTINRPYTALNKSLRTERFLPVYRVHVGLILTAVKVHVIRIRRNLTFIAFLNRTFIVYCISTLVVLSFHRMFVDFLLPAWY